MNDVWRELEERLKQKAKSLNELVEDSEKFQSFMERLASEQNIDLFKVWTPLFKDNKWVRLEDVKEAIQQLKQNYIVIEKKKFKDEIVSGQLSTNAIINDLHEKIEEIIKNFISFKASFIEELLKK